MTIWLLAGSWLTGPALTVLHADSVAPEDQAQWADYLPPHLVWLPLVARNGQLLGALLLAGQVLVVALAVSRGAL